MIFGLDRHFLQKGDTIARSSSRNNRYQKNSGYRVNQEIRHDQVRLIGDEGEQLGVMSAREARYVADEAGLDLVEVAPKAQPPVCKIMDYGKFKYQQSKKESKKTDTVSLKTVRLRPKTDDHDLQTKLNRAQRFLEKGNQVRFVMQMRGRERQHTDLWVEALSQMMEDLGEQMSRDIRVVSRPQSQGWQITSIVEPS